MTDLVGRIRANLRIENLNYKWFKNGIEIPNETSSTIIVSESGSYYFTASNGSSVTSSSITLNISSLIYSQIFSDGYNLACEGSTLNLNASYYSNNATYQWQRNNVNIFNATNRFLEISESGIYDVKVIDATCSALSLPEKFSFSKAIIAPILTLNGDTTLCGGNSIDLLGRWPKPRIFYGVEFQWQKDGINIPNANSIHYNTKSSGIYNLIYKQNNCISKSKSLTIVSKSKSQIPKITAGNITQICSGSININQNFDFDFSNYPTYFKQDYKLNGNWYKDGILIENSFGNNFSAIISGNYKMKYGSGDCETESNSIDITIGGVEFEPKITVLKYYGDTNLCGNGDGLDIRLDNKYLNLTNTTYQWQKNNQNLQFGNGSSLYVQQPDTYKLIVNNGTCIGVSNSILITNNSALTITPYENNLECSNRATLLDLGGYGISNNSIIWKKDNNIIPNENSHYMYAYEPGIYTATIAQNGCNAVSPPFELLSGNVPNPPEVNSTVISPSVSTTLTATGCNGTVNWFNVSSGGTSLGAGNIFITPIINTSTKFYAECTNETCTSLIRKEALVTICDNSYSVKSGNWNDTSVWSCGLVPNFATRVKISDGHIVNVPSGTHEAKNVTLVGNVNFDQGGEVKITGN